MVGGTPEQRATILDGRYRLDRALGEGAFGRVYLAFDTRLQRTVAVKELSSTKTSTDPRLFEQYRARFEREARAAGGIFHPNLVNVFELAIDPHNDYYLIMEYVDGTNLRDLLAQVGKLPVERAVQITLDVARALEAVHEQDIVHRDLKPANIMLTRRGVVKLTDFGIAQLGHESLRTQVSAGHPGTPLYMSPEQQQHTGYLDGRSDLYSLGLVLYEILAGEPYARQKLPLESLRPDLSAPILHIFYRLIEQDPQRRYQTADAVITDLQALSSAPTRDTNIAADAYVGTVGTLEDPVARTELGSRAPVAVPPGTIVAAQAPPTGDSRPTGAAVPSGGAPPGRPTSAAPRRRWPLILGSVGVAIVVIAFVGGWFIARSANQATASQTASPIARSQTAVSPVASTESLPASATVGTSAGTTPTVSTTVPVTLTPTTTASPPTRTPTIAPTTRASATIRPDFQTITDQRYFFTLSYPKAWQRSDDETDQDTLYSFRMSPSAVFIVAKEDNPKFAMLDAYIEDEFTSVTTLHPDWKVGSRARQVTMLSGQPAKIADFLVPTAAGQDYHYYVLTTLPNRAWGLFFTMPVNDFGKYQHDIDDVVRSFMFCPGNVCAPQAAAPQPARGAWSQDNLIAMIGDLPRRRESA